MNNQLKFLSLAFVLVGVASLNAGPQHSVAAKPVVKTAAITPEDVKKFGEVAKEYRFAADNFFVVSVEQANNQESIARMKHWLQLAKLANLKKMPGKEPMFCEDTVAQGDVTALKPLLVAFQSHLQEVLGKVKADSLDVAWINELFAQRQEVDEQKAQLKRASSQFTAKLLEKMLVRCNDGLLLKQITNLLKEIVGSIDKKLQSSELDEETARALSCIKNYNLQDSAETLARAAVRYVLPKTAEVAEAADTPATNTDRAKLLWELAKALEDDGGRAWMSATEKFAQLKAIVDSFALVKGAKARQKNEVQSAELQTLF